MIAVIFALPAESSAFLRELRPQKKVELNGLRTIRGQIGDREIEVLHCGVGEQIAARRIDILLNANSYELVISTGFAGGANDDASVGDLVLAENFSSSELLASAQRSLAGERLRTGKMFSSPRVIETPEERKEISRAHGAIAVDMETAAIAGACRQRNVPLLCLRVISDTIANPLPAPAKILFDIETQRTDAGALSRYFIQHPLALWRLLRFSFTMKRARDVLARALISICSGGL